MQQHQKPEIGRYYLDLQAVDLINSCGLVDAA